MIQPNFFNSATSVSLNFICRQGLAFLVPPKNPLVVASSSTSELTWALSIEFSVSFNSFIM